MRGRDTVVVAGVGLFTALFWASKPHLFDSVGLLSEATVTLWDLFRPGGRLHPRFFLEHRGHVFLEVLLLLLVVVMYFQQSYKPSSSSTEPLSEAEIDMLCQDWQPEPLPNPLPPHFKLWEPPVISSPCGAHVIANGKRVLSLVSTNFLGMSGDEEIMAQCHACINKYGVGSCGPRGFYGTIDVHLQLEERLAEFMGTESALIYSYDLATLPSVIPAFANRSDLIICDEGANYAILKGCNLSRAKVQYFKHNDMADLERLLKEVVDSDKKSRGRPLNRRYIAVEGIYANTGQLAPLDVVYRLKEQYKFRLIVDESMSLGVVGERGRGACEHFGLNPGDAEIISASLGNSLASVGGFCAGADELVEHQRLNGLGYCFSASLPPFLAVAAIGVLDRMKSSGRELQARVAANAGMMRSLLQEVPGLVLVGGEADAVSPLLHLQLVSPRAQVVEGDMLLQRVVDECLESNALLLTTSKYSILDKQRSAPSIKIAVTAEHQAEDLQFAATALKAAARKVLCGGG